MGGFYRHIAACNTHEPAHFLPLRIRGALVGRLLPHFAEVLAQWPSLFRCSPSAVEMDFPAGRQIQVAAELRRCLGELVAAQEISHLHGEQYPVVTEWGAPVLLTLDRAAAPYFGIRAFGQHVNGYVRSDQGLMLWVAKRSADRRVYPGHLDNIAAGGLPHGISLRDNLAKECWEEAAIPDTLARQAVAVGAISYNAAHPSGFKPDTLFCYDLELPETFVPRCTDGEVERFYLMPVEEVIERVCDSDQFKLNCNLVVIDFLIRHGYLEPDHDEYISLVQGLRPGLAPI